MNPFRAVSTRVGTFLARRRHHRRFKASFTTNLSPNEPFDLSVLKRVGRHSYGMLNIVAYGHPDEGLEIGDFVSIAPDVVFHLGGGHRMDTLSSFPFDVFALGMPFDPRNTLTKGPIRVRDDVWFGTRALVLSGVEIGQGAVIGAGAVVAGSIPPYAIAVGNPARVVKYRFSPEIIDVLVKRMDYGRLDLAAIRELHPRLLQPLTRDSLEVILARLGL